MSVDVRHGDYRRVMHDVTCDALISDAPYSPRTHAGQRVSAQLRKSTIDYAAISPRWCAEFAEFWSFRARNWAVIFCDHLAFRWHEAAWEARGWYTFAPVFLKPNPPPRFSGDGPALALEFLLVARAPWKVEPMGSLSGYYEHQVGHDRRPSSRVIAGRKPLQLMRDIVREYTLPGATVADSTCGSGTTLIAAAIEGRNAIGCDISFSACEISAERIEREYTHTVWNPNRMSGKQEWLLDVPKKAQRVA